MKRRANICKKHLETRSRTNESYERNEEKGHGIEMLRLFLTVIVLQSNEI